MADGRFARCRVEAGSVAAVLDPAEAHRLCAGHFPGNPIVPGSAVTALMVDVARRLASPARAWVVDQAGFVAPLRPDQPIEIEATARDADVVRVTVLQAGRRAARGVVRFTPTPEAS